ncbi:hypothetical protein YC2023_007848 [Brassica napus]
MTGPQLPDERAQAVRSLGSLLNYVRHDPRKGTRRKLGLGVVPNCILSRVVPLCLVPLYVRQMTYLGSRLAVDDLPGSRLAVDDLPGSRLVNAKSSEITDFKVNCKNNLWVDQTTKIRHKNLPKRLEKSRRLPGSPDDFLEVQTTLSEDFQEVQTTSRRLTSKSSQKSSRSEKLAYQIQI